MASHVNLFFLNLYSAFNSGQNSVTEISKNNIYLFSTFINVSLKIKPETKVVRKNSVRRQTEGTLRGTRFVREPILVWATLYIL